MTTIMASLRRLLNRKRRCLFVFILVFLFLITISWMLNQDHISSPVVEMELNMSRPDSFIPPKWNVLPEPPKPQVLTTALAEMKKEKPIEKPVESVQLNSERNLTKKDSAVIRRVTISIQGTGNKTKETIVIKSEDKQLASETVKIEIAKNKTLAQMGVLGNKEVSNDPKKIIFAKEKWNLSVSFEDIGNIMKDTAFFNNLKPLDLRGPLLTSTKNRTANFSLSMPIKMGFCDCWERYCFCCAQLVNKQLHLNTKSCANFTFMSKSHELDVTFSLDGVNVHKETISADVPPLLCMGSIPKVADMCVHFFNMTYRVDRLGLHKSHLMGCTDFSFNVYNKTVNVFPVDCFQIPGDPNHHPKHEQIILPNFVP